MALSSGFLIRLKFESYNAYIPSILAFIGNQAMLSFVYNTIV